MKITHGVVYSDAAYFAGWPANHGAWQWGDEFLVGFMRGPYARRNSMHRIAEPFERLLSRSHDGGRTWRLETPNVDFTCEKHATLSPPYFDLRAPDTIVRLCGVYDTGGDFTHPNGGIYLSRDRGYRWDGPFGLFNHIPDNECVTARTRTLPSRGLVFVTLGDENAWGTDYTVCMKMERGSLQPWSVVLRDKARAVMPAVAEMQNGRIVVALRRRQTNIRACWVDSMTSDDGGATWRGPFFVGDAGSSNGNPPALCSLPDGRLLCVFGNRDFGTLNAAISEDGGQRWAASFHIRDSESERIDIGYPQLFMRRDGVPVCVYYWTSDAIPVQHIACSTITGL